MLSDPSTQSRIRTRYRPASLPHVRAQMICSLRVPSVMATPPPHCDRRQNYVTTKYEAPSLSSHCALFSPSPLYIFFLPALTHVYAYVRALPSPSPVALPLPTHSRHDCTWAFLSSLPHLNDTFSPDDVPCDHPLSGAQFSTRL